MTQSELQNGIIMWKYWPFYFIIFLWKTSVFSSKETVRCVLRSQAGFSETRTFQYWLIRCNHNMENQWRKYLQLIIFLMAMTTSQWNKSTSNNIFYNCQLFSSYPDSLSFYNGFEWTVLLLLYTFTTAS